MLRELALSFAPSPVSYTHLISNYIIFAPIFFASIGLKTDISGLTPEIFLFCVCFVIVAPVSYTHLSFLLKINYFKISVP